MALAFTQIGTLFSGGVLGAAAAAYFRVARQIAAAIVKPTRLVMPALYPELARLWASGDIKGLRRLMTQTTFAGGAVALALLVVAAFAGAWLLEVLLGAEFAGAAPVMTWLIGSAAIGVWALPLEPFLISTGRATMAFAIRAGVTVLYIPAMFLGLQRFGLMGLGYATAGAMLLLFLVQIAAVVHTFRAPAEGRAEDLPRSR